MTRKLDDWIDNYLIYTNNSEPSEMYRLWTAISVIAACLQRKCRFNWGALTFYPNMYIVLVGPPAARKGTAMNQGFKFIEQLDIKRSAEATTRESLIQQLKNSAANDHSPDGQLIFHASLTIWAQELTVFLGYHNHQLLSDLTDWYDCRNYWKYETKHEGIDDITGVFVNLFGATTPDLIRSTMPLDAIGGGLTSRMIFIFEENKGKVVYYPGLSDEEHRLGSTLMDDLERIHTMRGRFRVADNFIEEWAKWYIAQEGNPPFKDNRFAGYFERRATHILKLCMIVNASRTENMVIAVSDLHRAIDILQRTERKMPRTFAGVGQSPYAGVLVQIMTDIGMRGQVTFAELQDTYKNDADKWALEKIMETLVASRFVMKPVMKDGHIIYKHRETFEKDEKSSDDDASSDV